MVGKRTVEIFSAGCSVCEQTIELVQDLACPSCEITILDMHDPQICSRAERLNIQSIPAVVIDGKLADCCSGTGPNKEALKAQGIGQPLP